jgi:solute carrier family 35 protein C2
MYFCSSDKVIDHFTWPTYFELVFPIGVTTALDILCSNLSLQYISVTIYTIIKTSVMVWTFVWALMFRIERFKFKTFASVCLICLGISLAISTRTSVSWTGVVFCMIAAASGGLRWALTERLATANEQCRDPFVSVFHFSPISAATLVPICLATDLVPFLSSKFAMNTATLVETLVLIACGGIIAFILLVVEVKLVGLTSSLTLGVLGQLKELTQITLAIVVFGDQLSPLNITGLVLSFVFVGVYKWIRRNEMREMLLASEAPTAVEHERVRLVPFYCS